MALLEPISGIDFHDDLYYLIADYVPLFKLFKFRVNRHVAKIVDPIINQRIPPGSLNSIKSGNFNSVLNHIIMHPEKYWDPARKRTYNSYNKRLALELIDKYIVKMDNNHYSFYSCVLGLVTSVSFKRYGEAALIFSLAAAFNGSSFRKPPHSNNEIWESIIYFYTLGGNYQLLETNMAEDDSIYPVLRGALDRYDEEFAVIIIEMYSLKDSTNTHLSALQILEELMPEDGPKIYYASYFPWWTIDFQR